jgi:hypothetical protein
METVMRLNEIDLDQFANALARQAEMIREAGSDVLADALALRAKSFELATVPAKAEAGLVHSRKRR